MSDLQSPTNPHFFQPLLPNFHSHLNIPRKFFSLYMEGKYEGKTFELRSEASEKTWKVKMESQRLTVGWNEFAKAHDLRVGDIIIFRHEGDLVFHVTILGSSCCEIQYQQEEQSNTESKTVSTKHCSGRKSGTCEKRQKMSSSVNDSRFLTLHVTQAALKRCRLYLPRRFTTFSEMERTGQKKITMLDKNGAEWQVNLVMDKRYKRFRFGAGFKAFLNAIDVKAHESFTMELIQKETPNPLMLKYCSKVKTPL